MELSVLNRNQLRDVIRLFTRQYHMKGYLFKLGLANRPSCERHHDEDNTAIYVLLYGLFNDAFSIDTI
jgi:hypothetical protein